MVRILASAIDCGETAGFECDRRDDFTDRNGISRSCCRWESNHGIPCPNCHCCEGWMAHLQAQGFETHSILTADIDPVKQQLGVPKEMASCHTAVIDGYVIEGHVLAEDIKRLLAEQSEVTGLAVPGMPVGTPGMESGGVRDAFTVFSFDSQGKPERFNSYPSLEDL